MYKVCKDSLYNLLNKAFMANFSKNNIEKEFSPFLEKGIKIRKVKKGEQYINIGTEIDKLSLMLTGSCHIIRYTLDGKSIVVDSMEGIQLFGVYEILNNIDCYSSTVSCIEQSYFIEIPVYMFRQRIFEDRDFTGLILKYMSYLLNRSYERHYKELMSTNEEIVLSYLYSKCAGKNLPYKILIDRKTMALELNISLRSLYRHIERLKNLGIISINCGKIMVDECQFKLMCKRIQVNS